MWDALDPSEKVPGQQHPITIMILTAELRHYLYKATQNTINTISQYNYRENNRSTETYIPGPLHDAIRSFHRRY